MPNRSEGSRAGSRGITAARPSSLAARVVVRVLALLGLTFALAPAPAQAGDYTVFWCAAPNGVHVGANPKFGTTGAYVRYGSTCGEQRGSIELGLGGLPRPGGMALTAQFIAPYSVGIIGAEVRRHVVLNYGVDTGGSTAHYVFRSTGPSPTAHEGCAYYVPCTEVSGTAWFNIPEASSLVWELGCGGYTTGTCGGAPGDRAVLHVQSLRAVLRDDELPFGALPTGTALDSGVHRDVESLGVSASDNGSGLLEVVAKIDDRVAGRLAGSGQSCWDAGLAPGPDYYTAGPCDRTVTGEFTVDTRVVADGEHRLRVLAVDAAGNEKLLRDAKFTVDNVPPPVPVSPPIVSSLAPMDSLRPGDTLVATPGGWTGGDLSLSYQWQRWSAVDDWSNIPGATGATYVLAKGDVDRKVRVVVTASNADGSAVSASVGTAMVKSGATVQVASTGPVASGDGPAPQLVVDREQRTVQVHYGAKIIVTGRLVDADGAPIADADVDVFEQISFAGAPWKKVATVKTDGQGGYVYRPVTQGSRILRFAYSARRDSGDYRATREVVISVTAAMSIKAVRRTISSRGLIHLKGRVRAKPLPAAGTWVEVQVLDAGVWRTIGTRRTSKTGRWSFKHRVRSVSRVTFAFRVRLRPVANVPAAESKSAPVKVRVR